VLVRGGVGWSGRIKQEIRKSGLAITADHGEPSHSVIGATKAVGRFQVPEGLNECFQLFAQRLVGAKEQRFRGGLAQLQHIADLLVDHAFVLVHEHGHALPLGQSEDVLTDGVEALAAEQICFSAGSRVGDIGCGSGVGVDLVEIDSGGAALVSRVAGMVDAEVGGDAIEPGAESCLCTVGLTRTLDAEEDLLGELFGDGLIVDHAVHKVNDGLAVLLNQVVEAGHVAGAQLEHDGGIVHVGEFTSVAVLLGRLEILKKRRAYR
jgi:hypothetical protein